MARLPAKPTGVPSARRPLPRSAGGTSAQPPRREPPRASATSGNKTDIRARMKEQLLKRQKEAEERSESFGGSFLDFGKEKVTVWKPGNGDHLIDIIPYCAGPNDPNTPEGEATYTLSVKVHRNLGPSKNQEAVCLAENYGTACPVCEHRIALRDAQEDKEVWKKLFPTKRSIYNVVVQDNEKELKKGVQVWNVADFYMEDHILNIMRGPVRPGQPVTETLIPFSHPEEGKSIAFKIDPPKSKEDYASYVGHRFVDRNYSTDEYLDAAHILDNFLTLLTYDQLYELYWGQQSKKVTEPLDETESEPVSDSGEEAPFEPDVSVADEDIKDYCPAGGKWGIDNNELSDCEQCEQDLWQACVNEKDRIQAETAESNRSRRRRMRTP